MQTDAVDKILEQWQRERPDLDASPMGVIGRLSRLSQHIDHAIQAALAPLGITSGEFDVLATLRRAGAPYQLNPTLLYQALMLSSGAMTNRLDRLEQAGYVRRLPDPRDRRGTLVQLTEEGVQLIDRAVDVHIQNEQRLLADLSDEEREKLTCIFSHWLQRFEASTENETKS
ncbi:MAG: MarR family winged helix-turn-helix transcriptional regulator [Chloroflexota bacterium]